MARPSLRLRLHPTDRRAILLGVAAGAEILIVEAVGSRGSAPTAALQALEAGASRAVRVVDPALETTDVHAVAFTLATAFDRLDVDLILFGDDADPDGIGDLAARVAHNMSATYLGGVVDLKRPAGNREGKEIDATIATEQSIFRFHIPLNAVLGIAADDSQAAPTPRPLSEPPAAHGALEVMSLADLKLDPALIRRRHDGRGAVEVSSRPLVTLQSAAAVAALLRR